MYMMCAGGETVDTPALGAGAARCGGSSPLPRTLCIFASEVTHGGSSPLLGTLFGFTKESAHADSFVKSHITYNSSMTNAFAFGNGITPKETFILLPYIIEDRGSRYSVSFGVVHNRDDIKAFLKQLKRDKAYERADHNTFAARIEHEGIIYETKQDDGETGAGMVILRMLEKHDVRNGVVCVTRWFGGVKLMGDRFKHVQDAALIAIEHMQQ